MGVPVTDEIVFGQRDQVLMIFFHIYLKEPLSMITIKHNILSGIIIVSQLVSGKKGKGH